MERKKSPQLIIFEGGDCCGKTTLLDKTYDELSKNFKVLKLKFPVYSGTYGEDILNHLKTFNLNDYDRKEGFVKLLEFSKKQTINKLDYITDLVKIINDGDYDYVLADRFVLSGYIYDVAWANIIDKEIVKSNLESAVLPVFDPWEGCFYTPKVTESFLEKAESVLEAYSFYFSKIKTIIIGKNPLVKKLVTETSKLEGRRVDAYDKNTVYQDSVSTLMAKVPSMYSMRRLVGSKAKLIDPAKFISYIDNNYLEKESVDEIKKILIKYTEMVIPEIMEVITDEPKYY